MSDYEAIKPILAEFFFQFPLYQRFELESDDRKAAFRCLSSLPPPGQPKPRGHRAIVADINGYNPKAQFETTYSVSGQPVEQKGDRRTSPLLKGELSTVDLGCRRTGFLVRFFIQYSTTADGLKYLIKHGQTTSIADFQRDKLKKFRKILPKERQKELTRAIGLAANGIGIGSFVYLRRLVEFLVNEAYEQAKSESESGVPAEDKFQELRMQERIVALSGYLPEFLVENKKLWGILSKGVHELTEQECADRIPLVEAAIEMILEEKLAAIEAENLRTKISGLISHDLT